MSRDYKLYLRDILKAAKRIERYIADVDKGTFKADDSIVGRRRKVYLIDGT